MGKLTDWLHLVVLLGVCAAIFGPIHAITAYRPDVVLDLIEAVAGAAAAGLAHALRLRLLSR